MPLYSLCCPECRQTSEHLMGMTDNRAIVKCPVCGQKMSREFHRDYSADRLQIQGETVAGGCNYSGWDQGLQMHISGKAHRQRVMDERGLVPFSPNPVMEKMRKTIGEIKKDAHPGDPEARAAVHKEQKEADYKCRRKATEAAFAKVKPPVLP